MVGQQLLSPKFPPIVTYEQVSFSPAVIAVATWDRMMLQSTLHSSLFTGENFASCKGGDQIVFTGSGFLKGVQYYMELTGNGTENQVTSALNFPLTDSEISFVLPSWPFTASEVYPIIKQVTASGDDTVVLGPRKYFFLLPYWKDFEPKSADKDGGNEIILNGCGFGPIPLKWATSITNNQIPLDSASFNFVCVFQDKTSPKEAYTDGQILSSMKIACQSPSWSNESWSAVQLQFDAIINLVLFWNQTVLEKVAYNSNIPTFNSFDFVTVNKPPFFTGMDLNMDISSLRFSNGFYSRGLWASDIMAGRLFDGTVANDELTQKLTFAVQALVESLFDIQPQITSNGTLTFSASSVGQTKIIVILRDDGGTQNNGVNTYSKNFTITIRSSPTDISRFSLIDPVVVLQNSPRTLIESFATEIFLGYFQIIDFVDQLQIIGFDVLADQPICFDEQPVIDVRGDLIFKIAEGFKGNTSVGVRYWFNDGSESGLLNFTIVVQYVNYPPSFQQSNSLITILENTHNSSTITSIDNFAFDICRGIWPEAAERGVYFTNATFRKSEADQNYTFQLILTNGNDELFQIPPYVTVFGTLIFELREFEFGNATFLIFLRDDGGTRNGGSDTSPPHLLKFQVIEVNQAPSFVIPNHFIFLEHHALFPIVVPKFALPGRWQEVITESDNPLNSFWPDAYMDDFRSRFQGPPSEINQTVTFIVAYASGDTFLFARAPTISNDGTLFLEGASYAFGEAAYFVSLRDNGGTAHGGKDIGFNYSASSVVDSLNTSVLVFRVIPVNTQPTIGSPSEIWFWTNPYCQDCSWTPTMMYQEVCCSPCPGPTCDSANCCNPISSGRLIFAPPVLNCSAGPFQTDQTLSFTVHVVSGDKGIFTRMPQIFPNCSVNFDMASGGYGSATINISALNSGGTDFNGSNFASKIVQIKILVGFVEFSVNTSTDRKSVSDYFNINISQIVDGDSFDPNAPSANVLSVVTDSFYSLRLLFKLCIDRYKNCAAYLKNGNGEIVPKFHFENNSILVLDEKNVAEMTNDLIAGVEVDSAFFEIGNKSNSSWKMSLEINVTEKRYRAPADSLQWAEGGALGVLFSATPSIVTTCNPRCDTASLNLELTGKHGFAEFEISLFSALTQVNYSLALTVVVLPTAHAPEVKYPYNLTIEEDGGPCIVSSQLESEATYICRPYSYFFNCSALFLDIDDWYPGGDSLNVSIDEPSRLHAAIFDNVLELTTQLHQHGKFIATIHDSAGLKSAHALIIYVSHVNHAPYLLNESLINITVHENDPTYILMLSRVLGDVDIVNEDDPYTTPDSLTYSASSMSPTIVSVEVRGDIGYLNFLPNQNGKVTVVLSATDSALARFSVNATVDIIFVPQKPILQMPLPFVYDQWSIGLALQRTWQVSSGSLCTFRKNVTHYTNLKTCKIMCLEDQACTSVAVFASDVMRCIDGSATCLCVLWNKTCMFSSNAQDAVCASEFVDSDTDKNCSLNPAVFYIKPAILFLNESRYNQETDFNMSLTFGDPDDCKTLIRQVNCSHNIDDISISALSSDATIVNVSIQNSTILLLTLQKYRHTNNFSDIVVAATATDSYNLSITYSFNVSVQRVNVAPTIRSLMPIELIEGQNSIVIQIKTLIADIGNWSFFDYNELADIGGDPLTISATVSDATLLNITVLRNCCVNGSALFKISIVPLSGQFGVCQIYVTAADSHGASVTGDISVSVLMVNRPPSFQFQSVLQLWRNNTNLISIPSFVFNVSRGVHNKSSVSSKGISCIKINGVCAGCSISPSCRAETSLTCAQEITSVYTYLSTEDCCLRTPARTIGDCWGSASIGQNITFSLTILSGDASIFMLLPTITADGILTFQLGGTQTGNVSFQVAVSDDGGTSNGGISTSYKPLTFVVAPTFDIDPYINVSENSICSPYSNVPRVCSLSNFVFNIMVSVPKTEYASFITFNVVQVAGNSNLIAPNTSVKINSNGTLTFTLQPDQYGQATFNARLFNNMGSTLVQSKLFVINVIPVNQAPIFCFSSNPLILIRNQITSIPYFVNSSAGGLPCAQLQGTSFKCDPSSSICGHRLPSPYELQQKLTFKIEYDVPVCSPFNCFDPLFSTIPSSYLSISPNGTLQAMACNRGTINVSVLLLDNGGTDNNGVDLTVQTLVVIVQQVNDVPSFHLYNNGMIYILEDSKDMIHGIALNISAGRCEESVQNSSFAIISSFSVFKTASIFINGSVGTLNYSLQLHKYGTEIFVLILSDSQNSTRKNLTINVLPVNDPPSFALSSSLLQFTEDCLSGCNSLTYFTSPGFLTNISKGGWSGGTYQNNEKLLFNITLLDGPSNMTTYVAIRCAGETGNTAWQNCTSGNATLFVYPQPHRFGLQMYQISVVNSGGVGETWDLQKLSFGPLSAPNASNGPFLQVFNLTILFRNYPPTFQFAASNVTVMQDIGCLSEAPFSNALNKAQCVRNIPGLQIRKGFVVSISAGTVYESASTCPDKMWLQPPDNPMYSCQDQNLTFTVLPRSGAVGLLQKPPLISPDGTLNFSLVLGQAGVARFNVLLTDSLNSSSNATLNIQVIPVNAQPTFDSPIRVIGFKNLLFNNTVLLNVSPGAPSEASQKLTFSATILSGSDLFSVNGLPSFSPNGILNFIPATNVFGEAVLNLTLTDDGGTMYGGVDTSIQHTVIIQIQFVDSPPSFQVRDLFLFEGSGPTVLQRFAAPVRPGPDNEAGVCSTYAGDCQNQSLTFGLVAVFNPDLFSILPYLNRDGDLYFTACARCSGLSLVSIRLVDNASISANLTGCVPCGSPLLLPQSCCYDTQNVKNNKSTGINNTIASFNIFVEPVNTAPDFQFEWNVKCNSTTQGCACPSIHSVNGMCASSSILTGRPNASLVLQENSDIVSIPSFASKITAAIGFLPYYSAYFGLPGLNFTKALAPTDFNQPGLEAANNIIYSPDRSVAVALEEYTNSVSLWAVDENDVLNFQDRRQNGDRIRFLQTQATSLNGQTCQSPLCMSLGAVCGLSSVVIENSTVMYAARGCKSLMEEDNFRNDSYRAESLWESVIGEWIFNSGSMYNGEQEMKTGSFEDWSSKGAKVSCAGAYCTYVASPQCPSSTFQTVIGPATFRDNTNISGAAVFVGRTSTCVNSVPSLYDLPPEISFSCTNLIASAQGYEVILFDGALNQGLYVTTNIDSMNIEDFSVSWPESISIEAVFSINILDSQEHPIISCLNLSCSKGWSLSWISTVNFQVSIYFRFTTPDTQYLLMCPRPSCENIQRRSPGAVCNGDWVHVVAMYDLKQYPLGSVYLNGQQLECQSTTDQTLTKTKQAPQASNCRTNNPLTIGLSEILGSSSTHLGYIYTIRIYRSTLTDDIIHSRNITFAGLLSLPDSRAGSGNYWTKITGEYVDLMSLPQYSEDPSFQKWTDLYLRAQPYTNQSNQAFPDVDFTDADSPGNRPFIIKGKFPGTVCRAKFCCIYQGKVDLAKCSKDSSHKQCVPIQSTGGQTTMQCYFPSTWEYGFQGTVMDIVCSDSWDSPQNFIWSAGCFAGCGIPYFSWSGTSTIMRFTLQSQLATLAANEKGGLSISRISSIGPDPSVSNEYESKAYPFSRVSVFVVDGAAKLKYWVKDGISYLFAANYWDGFNRALLSSIFRIDDIINGDLALVQGIPTNGARDCVVVIPPGSPSTYVAIANYYGTSYLYRWNGPSVVSGLEIINPGNGYVDGDLGIQRTAKLNGSMPFFGKFTVDGPIGAIFKLEVLKTANITGCTLAVYSGMRVKTNQTARCKVGSRLVSGELIGNVTSVGTNGQIMNITLIHGAKAFGTVPLILVDTTSDIDDCTCLLGSWTHCIELLTTNNTIQVRPSSGIGGFLGIVTQVSGEGSILNMSVTSPGLGYDSDFGIVIQDASVFAPTCSCSGPGGAAVDWKFCISAQMHVGAIQSATIVEQGSMYFPDEEVMMQYNSSTSVITGTVTQVSVKSLLTSNCILQVYSALRTKPNSTKGCRAGMNITANISGQAIVGKIIAVDSQGRILNATLNQPFKAFGGVPSLSVNATGVKTNVSTCTCLLGTWNQCLSLVLSQNNITIVPSNRSGGFEAAVTQVDSLGRISAVTLLNRGAGYLPYFSITVIEQFSTSTPCSCGDSNLPWTSCISVVVASPDATIIAKPLRDTPTPYLGRKVRSLSWSRMIEVLLIVLSHILRLES